MEQGIRALLITSGTLSPLKSFTEELQVTPHCTRSFYMQISNFKILKIVISMESCDFLLRSIQMQRPFNAFKASFRLCRSENKYQSSLTINFTLSLTVNFLQNFITNDEIHKRCVSTYCDDSQPRYSSSFVIRWGSRCSWRILTSSRAIKSSWVSSPADPTVTCLIPPTDTGDRGLYIDAKDTLLFCM